MISLTKHDFLAHLLQMCNFLKHDFLARPKRYTLRWRRRRDAHDRQQVAEQVCSKTFEPFSETPENTHYRRDQEIVHAAEESWVWNRPAYETFRSRLDCDTAPTAAKWNSNFLIGRVDRTKPLKSKTTSKLNFSITRVVSCHHSATEKQDAGKVNFSKTGPPWKETAIPSLFQN